MKRVAVLGSTGSIGVSTLDVLARHPDRYVVTALAARSNRTALFDQCLLFRPAVAVLQDPAAARLLALDLRAAECPTAVACGADALNAAAAGPEVDVVMAAIVGAAGLPSTLAAARAGKHVLVAYKEAHRPRITAGQPIGVLKAAPIQGQRVTGGFVAALEGPWECAVGAGQGHDQTTGRGHRQPVPVEGKGLGAVPCASRTRQMEVFQIQRSVAVAPEQALAAASGAIVDDRAGDRMIGQYVRSTRPLGGSSQGPG